MKARQRIVDTLPWHDDLLCAGSEEPDEPLSEAERAAQFDDFYWDRLDREMTYFGAAR